MTVARDIYTAVVSNKPDAHTHSVLAYVHCKNLLASGITKVQLTVRPAPDDISSKLRGLLHGCVLKQIAEQVALPVFDTKGNDTGQRVRYAADVWKQFFTKHFLARWEMRRAMVLDKATSKLRPAKKATPHEVIPSTESLGNKAYAEFVDNVIAYATAEHGVAFEFKTQAELEMQAYIAELKRRGAE